jgi:predicted Zn-dependent protease with MMP-like domain
VYLPPPRQQDPTLDFGLTDGKRCTTVRSVIKPLIPNEPWYHTRPSSYVALDNDLVVDVEPSRFEEMVVTALDELPEELGRLMSNVAVTVEHAPGPPGLLGLYEGIPLTSRTSQYAGFLPDKITIYRQAICAACRTEQEVADQVRRTVIHEIAHHFGIDDDRLDDLGW